MSFQVYRGLQKPLEFMGLKGRYVYIGAATIVAAILIFIVGFLLTGFLAALLLALFALGGGCTWILIKQRKGLHSKPVHRGIYIVTHLIHIEK